MAPSGGAALVEVGAWRSRTSAAVAATPGSLTARVSRCHSSCSLFSLGASRAGMSFAGARRLFAGSEARLADVAGVIGRVARGYSLRAIRNRRARKPVSLQADRAGEIPP
jgi:hypothetical protein